MSPFITQYFNALTKTTLTVGQLKALKNLVRNNLHCFSFSLLLLQVDPSILKPKEHSFSVIDPQSEFFTDFLWLSFGVAIAILVTGLIFEYFRHSFFRDGVAVGQGLSYNSGYNGKGEDESKKDRANSSADGKQLYKMFLIPR